MLARVAGAARALSATRAVDDLTAMSADRQLVHSESAGRPLALSGGLNDKIDDRNIQARVARNR